MEVGEVFCGKVLVYRFWGYYNSLVDGDLDYWGVYGYFIE